MSTTIKVFSVQDETGTVTQLTLLPSPSPVLSGPIAVGDVGIYSGFPDDGTASITAPVFQSLQFVVSQVLNPHQFSVQTNNANMADWPANGHITWQTGANATEQSTVLGINGANAYIDVDYFSLYHTSRGNSVPAGATTDAIQNAIVKATDYLDQKYRFNGIKLLQRLGNTAASQANATVYETWLTPYALTSSLYLTPSVTTQTTEWPRQGVVDFSGNTIRGIPPQVKDACALLAIRVLAGINLQPDYDPNVVANGGIVSQVTKKIGPLETSIMYDTKLGLGFFASFPQIDRMLSRAGLLFAAGGRTVIR